MCGGITGPPMGSDNVRRKNGIKWFKEIQNGSGLSREDFPEYWKGSLAKRSWDDPIFTYGMEYGILFALINIYTIEEEDLK